jgi:hypothetical protein
MGLSLAVVPHFDDNSGGENYDSRFCYMGGRRFDLLQEMLPPDVTILGIDAYTGICFDPNLQRASVFGQSGITLIGDGDERHFRAGETIGFEDFHSSARHVMRSESGRSFGYEFSDNAESMANDDDPLASLSDFVERLSTLKEPEKVELLARIAAARTQDESRPGQNEDALIDLVLSLREELRQAKRFDVADQARRALEDMGLEIGDSPQGAQWTRR